MHPDNLRKVIAGHMPELDALRGIAILWVILHNAALDNTGSAQGFVMKAVQILGNSGWVGVQLFFVLSGFLITGILLDGRGMQNQFRNFYARRTLRIFPLYYGFLLLVFFVLPLLGVVDLKQGRGSEQLLYWTYLINWGLPFLHDVTFPHLWSLAIEEQYYLFWPLLVIMVNNRTLIYVCGALIISAVCTRAFLVIHYDPIFANNAMYTFTIARWDSLAIGSLLAVALRHPTSLIYLCRYVPRAFVALTLVLTVQVVLLKSFSSSGVVGIFNQTSIALWFALLILLSIVPWHNQLDILRPMLSNRFFRWIGNYSYAIYVFHFPAKMIWFTAAAIAVVPNAPWQQLGVAVYNFIGVTMLATVAAYISWHSLEQPFLRLKRHFATPAAAAVV